jgi:phosphomannomutase
MDYSIVSRSYDLRGVYKVDIDDNFFFRLWYAFAKVTGKNRIALGYDARLSSPALKVAFTRGVNLAGATLIDIGMCSSDMLSFATCYYEDIEAGVMITASHNPKEYNGMKSLSHSGEPYNLKKYGPELLRYMQEVDISEVIWSIKNEQRNVLEDWVTHILSLTSSDTDFSQYTIVADGGSGVAWVFMPWLAEKAWFRLIPLFLDPDGDFPFHHPNPMMEENRADAKKSLLENNADVAFIFDGDADRVILLDETGEQINSAVISAAIADSILSSESWAKFIGNAVTSHNLRDFIESRNSIYIREKVGHVYIRERMMADSTIAFAGEHSAHYFFRDNYYMDSGIVAAMVFLDLVARSGKKVSEFIAQYQKYISLEETNFEVIDPKGIIQKLWSLYASYNPDFLDGITISYEDGSWWNFRPSSNEPLLRLNMEAKTQERFDLLYNEIYATIESLNSD